MATWQELSLDSFEAAKQLLNTERWRSSVSRSYYAAYCAVTDKLTERGVSFAHGWNNPGHEQLPNLILNNLTLPRNARWQIKQMVNFLRRARENADYRPGHTINKTAALASVRRAEKILQELGVL